MCGTKETSTTVVSGTQKAEPTAAELELQNIQLGQYKEIAPMQTELQKSAYDLGNKLLTGSTDLPGFFSSLAGGISPELTGEISQKAVADIMPSFQSSGILDSGVAASIAGRTAGDIRRGTAEYNQQNLLSLLNLALSGSTQLQAPTLATSSNLASQLAGLRSLTTNQTSTGTVKSNPFATAFYSSLGTSLGTGFGNWK